MTEYAPQPPDKNQERSLWKMLTEKFPIFHFFSSDLLQPEEKTPLEEQIEMETLFAVPRFTNVLQTLGSLQPVLENLRLSLGLTENPIEQDQIRLHISQLEELKRQLEIKKALLGGSARGDEDFHQNE